MKPSTSTTGSRSCRRCRRAPWRPGRGRRTRCRRRARSAARARTSRCARVVLTVSSASVATSRDDRLGVAVARATAVSAGGIVGRRGRCRRSGRRVTGAMEQAHRASLRFEAHGCLPEPVPRGYSRDGPSAGAAPGARYMPSVSLTCGRTRWPTCPVGLPWPVGGSLQDLEAIARQQVLGDAGPLGVGEGAHGVHEHAPRLQAGRRPRRRATAARPPAAPARRHRSATARPAGAAGSRARSTARRSRTRSNEPGRKRRSSGVGGDDREARGVGADQTDAAPCGCRRRPPWRPSRRAPSPCHPGAAHRSATRSPGCAPTASATHWLARSCT